MEASWYTWYFFKAHFAGDDTHFLAAGEVAEVAMTDIVASAAEDEARRSRRAFLDHKNTEMEEAMARMPQSAAQASMDRKARFDAMVRAEHEEASAHWKREMDAMFRCRADEQGREMARAEERAQERGPALRAADALVHGRRGLRPSLMDDSGIAVGWIRTGRKLPATTMRPTAQRGRNGVISSLNKIQN